MDGGGISNGLVAAAEACDWQWQVADRQRGPLTLYATASPPWLTQCIILDIDMFFQSLIPPRSNS